MEHNAPHPSAAFEGYYNKFSLPSGAHLVLVVCQVKNAKERPNHVCVRYVPPEVSKTYQRDIFPDEMEMKSLDSTGAFVLEIPKMGFVKWAADSTTEYAIETESFALRSKTTSRTPWSSQTNTPEGILANLPLPLHWHVHSLSSTCQFSLKICDYNLPAVDSSGTATVHQEKNYASSFPSAHMWVQAREGERGICCAGGEILGMEAFLLGYRSKDLEFDLRPPFALRVLGFGLFMSYATDWDNRSFELRIRSFRRKVEVTAKAPKGSFFSLSPPFPEGHRENYLGQSFQASVIVKVYESGWLTPWRLVREDVFENGSLEFGAEYYPPAGSKERFN